MLNCLFSSIFRTKIRQSLPVLVAACAMLRIAYLVGIVEYGYRNARIDLVRNHPLDHILIFPASMFLRSLFNTLCWALTRSHVKVESADPIVTDCPFWQSKNRCKNSFTPSMYVENYNRFL